MKKIGGYMKKIKNNIKYHKKNGGYFKKYIFLTKKSIWQNLDLVL